MASTGRSAVSGLERMREHQQMRSLPSDEPSLGRLFGVSFDEVEHGRIVVSVQTRPDFANPQGTVHGGVLATLLDIAMSCAVQTTLDPGVGHSTLELKVNYIRPGRLDGDTLVATGTVVHVGRRTGTAEGRVVNRDGKLIAHGTTTCIILHPTE